VLVIFKGFLWFLRMCVWIKGRRTLDMQNTFCYFTFIRIFLDLPVPYGRNTK